MITKFEVIDTKTPGPQNPVLLIGGSNARRWTKVDGYLPRHEVINCGFGGARLSDSLLFYDRIVLPYSPTTIIVNAVGNDLSSGISPEKIRDTAHELIKKIHLDLPDAHTYFIGLAFVRRSTAGSEACIAILAMNEQLE